MANKKPMLLPAQERLLASVGENLRLARLRRRLSAQQVADRAGVSRPTLSQLEKGAPGVSIGLLLQVLVVLGMEKDILQLAGDDVLGRKLEDAKLTESRRRAPKRR